MFLRSLRRLVAHPVAKRTLVVVSRKLVPQHCFGSYKVAFCKFYGAIRFASLNSHLSTRYFTSNTTSTAAQPPVPIISKAELEDLIKNRKGKYVLVDVRKPHELEHGVIETARNIPLQELQSALQLDEEDFEERYGFPKPKKSDLVVFYCRAGVRGENACRLAAAAGYTNVKNYKGAFLEWFYPKTYNV